MRTNGVRLSGWRLDTVAWTESALASASGAQIGAARTSIPIKCFIAAIKIFVSREEQMEKHIQTKI
jgi:hypothetical protein